MEILCFYAGMAFFYYKSLCPLLLLLGTLFFRPNIVFIYWFSAAIFWCFFHQWWTADHGLPSTNIIQNAKLTGYVTSIPLKTTRKIQFQFFVEQLNGQPTQANIILSCYHPCPKIRAGQYWQLQAKLKKPINLANPGGFDYVSWLQSRHIHWVGNIHTNTILPLDNYPTTTHRLITFREYLSDQLAVLFKNTYILGIIEALTIGLTTHVNKAHWDLFRRTGTTHLIDISGEHIALIAGLSFWLLKRSWKLFGGLCLRFPAQKLASLGAIMICIFYSFISGFAVPTQRSLITCSLILWRHFAQQRLTIWQAWRYALFIVLMIEPHSVFMLGFYFSFIAVAILILINQRIKADGFRKKISMQLACMLGLMPLSLYWFSYGSINGLIANLIAIPWVGLAIVPLALLVTFISPWMVIPGTVCLLKWLISNLIQCLHWIDSLEMMNINFTFISSYAPLVIMLGMGVLLCLPKARFYLPASLLIIASFFPNYEKIKVNTARVDVLDVGQGLSVVVRTAQHVLIYDTGMKFYQSSDMAKLVIIPYLNKLGIKQLDKVVISHPDLDHRGGLESLTETYTIHELIVDDPSFYKKGVSCHEYPSWTWEGVAFRFFPIISNLKGKNNHSCILQISNDAGKILLSGDIERRGEDYLIKTYGKQLSSTIMLIPHHGSKTSSSFDYLAQISPKYAIASYGFDNRYHFPHEKTMKNYEQLNIPIYNTPDCGMVRIELSTNQVKPQCYKKIGQTFALFNPG